MPEYLLSGVSKSGEKSTERIEANSTDEAFAEMAKCGYTDIVLHTDDVMAERADPEVWDSGLSPGEYVGLTRLSELGLWWFLVRSMYVQGWLLWGGLGVWMALRRVNVVPWSWLDFVLLAGIAFPFGFATFLTFAGPRRTYNRLSACISWGLWQEALRFCDELEDSNLKAEDLAFDRAKALAGLGRLGEAVRAVAPFGDGKAMPKWMYHGRLADVYYCAGDRQTMVEQSDLALELAPDNPTTILEAARSRLCYRGDVASTPALIERAKQHKLSELLAPACLHAEGVLALELGRPREANDKISAAIRSLSPLRHASPLVGALLDQMRLHLAIACCELGQRERAEALYRVAEPRARALRDDALIRRYQRVADDPQRYHIESDSPYRPPSV